MKLAIKHFFVHFILIFLSISLYAVIFYSNDTGPNGIIRAVFISSGGAFGIGVVKVFSCD